MANIKSAKKRILTNKRQKEENKLVKSSLSTFIKKYKKLLAENKVAEAEKMLPELVGAINSAASKGVLHQNNASRKVAKLSAALAKVKGNQPKEEKVEAKVEVAKEEKPAAKKATTAKKTTTTKAAAEKATATKTTAKATTAKKTAAKKETAKATEEPAKKTTAKKTTTTKKTATKKDAE